MMSKQPQFDNTPIDVEELPRYELLDPIPLEKNYLKVIMIACTIWAILLVVVFFVMTLLVTGEHRELVLLLAGSVFILLVIFPYLISYYGFFQKAYLLRERDIVYKKGLIWRSTTVIPFNRIQHSEVNNGPIDRIFDLASLKVFTAGGSSSDLEIPGLTVQCAHQLKEYITSKTGLDEEE